MRDQGFRPSLRIEYTVASTLNRF